MAYETVVEQLRRISKDVIVRRDNVRAWAISNETPVSATKGSANMRQDEEPPRQQLTAHLHMLSLEIVSMRSSKPIIFSKMS